MTNWVKMRQPCPSPKCDSSDGYHIHEDGHGYCFVCTHYVPSSTKEDTKDLTGFTFQYLPWRGITRQTMETYNISTKVAENGEPDSVGFRYPNGTIKSRGYRDKVFKTTGEGAAPSLFGADKFPAGGNRSIVITEGELDAASAHQMLGIPAVSVRSSSSARKDCAAFQKYLDSFERIYLALDDDEPGRKAAAAIAELFNFNKVYSVPFSTYKDANAYLDNGKDKEFRNAFNAAKRFMPSSIVSSLDDFNRIIDEDFEKPFVPYPWDTLQSKSRGIRTGEFVLITAPEGIGKTEFIRGLEYHLLTTTDVPIGAIHIEENKARQLKGLAGYDLNLPAHLPESGLSNEEIKSALAKITKGRDDRLHIYPHFGSDDPDVLLSTIRFMVAVCGCKYVFLDHISMVVSGLALDDERKTLDYLSTALATMCVDLDFTLFCISHINDDGQTRGSRNIGKVAHLRIDLSRDLVNPDEASRNLMYLTISKNRTGASTGPGGILRFDPETFKMSQYNPELEHVPVE